MKTRALPFALAAGLLMAAMPGAVSAAPAFKCESKGKATAVVMSLSEIMAFDVASSDVTGVKVSGHWDGQYLYHCVKQSTRGDLEIWRVGKGTDTP